MFPSAGAMDRALRIFVNCMKEHKLNQSPTGEIVDEDLDDGLPPASEMVDKAVRNLQEVLEQAATQPRDFPCTWVAIARELEQKPHLEEAAIRVYEEAVDALDALQGARGWEPAVVRQMLGALCLRRGRLQDAESWLAESAELASKAPGHPREQKLFASISSRHSRGEFAAMVARLRAKASYESGDAERARALLQESEQLLASPPLPFVPAARAAAASAPGGVAPVAGGAAAWDGQQLWAAEPQERRTVARYRFEGSSSSATVTLDLNEHLGLGEAASATVHSSDQIRVDCTADSVKLRLRLHHEGRVWEFRLLLHPLALEIIPEDTTLRLRGAAGRRRLELLLVFRDKDRLWYGELLSDKVRPLPKAAVAAERPGPPAAAPAASPTAGPPRAQEPRAVPEPCDAARGAARPAACGEQRAHWVESVEGSEAQDKVTLAVKLGCAVDPPSLSLEDLELEVNASGSLRLSVRGKDLPVLTLEAPAGADVATLAAKWRKATGVLELRFLRAAPAG